MKNIIFLIPKVFNSMQHILISIDPLFLEEEIFEV